MQEKLREWNLKGATKLFGCGDGNAFLAALDGAHVRAMQPATVGEFFLGKTGFGAQTPDERSDEDGQRRIMHSFQNRAKLL